FFFSSRRRHTRSDRDWSSDVCSSDLPQRHNAFSTDARAALLEALAVAQLDSSVDEVVLSGNGPSFCSGGDLDEFGTFTDPASARSEERRVGKECRSRWSA